MCKYIQIKMWKHKIHREEFQVVMYVKNNTRFSEAIEGLDTDIKYILLKISKDVQEKIQEIRIRTGRPIIVKIESRNYYVNTDGTISEGLTKYVYITTKDKLLETFNRLCQYSVYTYQDQINNGFITLRGGHRVGICGSAVVNENIITNIKDISSINLRIARMVPGVASDVINLTMRKNICGLLICGKPGSGKTTLLKDITRQISSGVLGRKYNIAVIDERGEIASNFEGEPQNDLGDSVDIFDGYPKVMGMMMAIRTMAPDLIICDEIGTQAESDAIETVLNSGVNVICTAHAGNEEEVYNKPQIRRLIASNAFSNIVILSSGDTPCKISKVIDTRGVMSERILEIAN